MLDIKKESKQKKKSGTFYSWTRLIIQTDGWNNRNMGGNERMTCSDKREDKYYLKSNHFLHSEIYKSIIRRGEVSPGLSGLIKWTTDLFTPPATGGLWPSFQCENNNMKLCVCIEKHPPSSFLDQFPCCVWFALFVFVYLFY